MIGPHSLRSFAILTLISSAVACRPDPGPAHTPPAVEVGLQAALSRAVEEAPAIRGAALVVSAPGIGLDWEGAAGVSDPENGAPMTAETPVRIASNTKTFVAAAVLRLCEEDRLDIDGGIATLLTPEHAKMLVEDGYGPEKMTVRHLLTHTSGLFDHSEPAMYSEAIVAEPLHQWSRTEQLRAAMEWGDPHAEPGEIYTYCDTGYVLLGDIIEQTTGLSLGAAVRELVDFERLGMKATWWETVEPRPAGVPDRAHQFLEDLDTFDFDPSFDLYGGGGLVCTMGDLARFTRALFTGGIFQDERTAALMLTTIDDVKARQGAGPSALPPGAYRMGVWVTEVGDFVTYRHTGFWGTLATYVPDLDLTITCTVNQNQGKAAFEALTEEALRLVASEIQRRG